MHHHGVDGSCHDGPGGMFRCDQCDLDNYRAAQAEEEAAERAAQEDE